MDALERDRALSRELRISWDAFFARFGRLTEVQRLAIPPILAGEDVLITSATASGKTEAACAPLVERFISSAEPWTILYISPTRALVNDLYERLKLPTERLRLSLARRTGEHKSSGNEHSNILLTTPESLDSLLCRGRTKTGHRLASVCAVVLDEIHLLHGNPRGEQVAWLLGRLEKLRKFAAEKGWSKHQDFQRVALSATVGAPQSILSRYLPGGQVVSVPGSRAIEVVGDTVHTALEPVLRSHLEEGLDQKVLVFCNARRRVDDLTNSLRSILHGLGFQVEAHHGSLSQKLREENEKKIKLADKMVLCSTSTLEIGVDIGDIDLVVLDGPPPDVSAFLQRIGRGKRRTNITRVLLTGKTAKDRLLLESTLHCARQGLLFAENRGECYGVGAQQLASYIFQAPKHTRSAQSLSRFLRDQKPELEEAGLIDFWVQRGELIRNNDSVYLGEFWTECSRSGAIHSNIEAPMGLTAIDDKTGMKLATNLLVNGKGQIGLAGKKLNIHSQEGRKVVVQQSQRSTPDAKWNYLSSLRGHKSFDLPLTLRAYLGLAEDDWPVIIAGSEIHIFHLSGPQIALILRICREILPEIEQADEFSIIVNKASKPQSLMSLEPDFIHRKIALELGLLEHKLGRPYANELLPTSVRLAEVTSWLKVEQCVSAIRLSRWVQPCKATEIRLRELICEYSCEEVIVTLAPSVNAHPAL